MVKPSLGSKVVSPCTLTVTVALAAPAAKLTVPEGSTPPTKSVPLAGLLPLPVTAQLAEDVAERSPVRVTVKVNGVAPLLPSAVGAFAGVMESSGSMAGTDPTRYSSSANGLAMETTSMVPSS